MGEKTDDEIVDEVEERLVKVDLPDPFGFTRMGNAPLQPQRLLMNKDDWEDIVKWSQEDEQIIDVVDEKLYSPMREILVGVVGQATLSIYDGEPPDEGAPAYALQEAAARSVFLGFGKLQTLTYGGYAYSINITNTGTARWFLVTASNGVVLFVGEISDGSRPAKMILNSVHIIIGSTMTGQLNINNLDGTVDALNEETQQMLLNILTRKS
jgi:hypothetical protein